MNLHSIQLPPKDQITEVSQLNSKIKFLLENSIGEIWIRGEISNLRRQSSGHIYFSLKDSHGQISGVCFRGNAEKLELILKDGMEVIGFGRISVYEPRGNYQIIFSIIIEDGLGRLQQQFEKLKSKLTAEGLFDPDRKQKIPSLPQKVGFVTSPSGAALRDFISILKRRGWNGTLIVIPVRVQGKEAAEEIVKGIELANQYNLCDLLVVGRGGGSLEDLWPFNEESVARAVAASAIPLISAVGHEIDFVLSDFAADKRAETPSAAAELISSEFVSRNDAYQRLRKEFHTFTKDKMVTSRRFFEFYQSRMKEFHPKRILENAMLKTDDLRGRIQNVISEEFHRDRMDIQKLRHRLQRKDPSQKIQFYQERIQQLDKRLSNSSHEATLRRGYTMVLNSDGNICPTGNALRPGDSIRIRFQDGTKSGTINAET